MGYSLGGVAIRNPDRGWSNPWERQGGIHELLDGTRAMDTNGFRRTYTMQWTHLTTAEYAVLEGLYLTASLLTLVMNDGETADVFVERLVPTTVIAGRRNATATLLEA